jgi:hypothetical protein
VPVFRYALEHWAADPYQAVVVHRGALTPEQETLLKELRPEGLKANIALRTLDLDTARSDELASVPRAATEGTLPRLVLLTPKTAQFPGLVWAGELTKENTAQLVDSPARRQIAERLGDGESAVWVLLEGKDRAASEAAAKVLQERLAYLDSVLTLPKLDPQDIVNGLVSVGQEDLRLEFSVLRLSREDPAERVFIQTLLATEPDLRDLTEPMAFPVFGQGRALYALVGAGLKHETIDKAATFLIGKCSCQVKELNPGADLLFAANWKAMVKEQQTAAPELPALAEITKTAAPVAVTFTPATAEAPTMHPPNRSIWPYLAAGGAVALVGAGLFLRRKPRV